MAQPTGPWTERLYCPPCPLRGGGREPEGLFIGLEGLEPPELPSGEGGGGDSEVVEGVGEERGSADAKIDSM